MSLTVKGSTKANEGHGCNVSNIICHNDLVISGSDDGKIKIWKESLDLVTDLGDGSGGGILSLSACDNTLYSCGTAEVIQMWDLTSAKLLGQVTSTLSQPQKLYVDKATKTLWAGDSQGNVAKFEGNKECGKYELVEEIWDLMVTSSPSFIYTARDRDVVVAEIVTGSKHTVPQKEQVLYLNDGWTSGTRVIVKSTFEGRSPFCIAGSRLCFMNREGRSVVMHDNSLEKKFPRIGGFPASDLIVNAIASASDHIIYTGGYDSIVKKWDLNSMTCLGSANLNCCINAIACRSESDAYVARSDGTVTRLGA